MAKIRKLVETGKPEQVLPVERSSTGRTWPKMTRTEVLPVEVQLVPVEITRECPECVFSHIFPYF